LLKQIVTVVFSSRSSKQPLCAWSGFCWSRGKERESGVLFFLNVSELCVLDCFLFCIYFLFWNFLSCCRAEQEREFTTENFSCCKRRAREIVGVAIFYLCFVLQEREVAKVGEVCVQFSFLFVCYIVAEREVAGAWEQVRERGRWSRRGL
jgi:hypothetical protein